jgi:DNA (cytosine-5)-methyltransferase 1
MHKLIDLFCSAGGAAWGYFLAGFTVVGVDIEPQPNYPFTFIRADATTYPLDGFDAAHGSPPCNDHSSLSGLVGKHGTGWMLQHTIDRFRAWGGPWVVENVDRADMPGATILCGTHFGLGAENRVLKRHRKFLTSFELPPAGRCMCTGMPVGGVYGHSGGTQRRGYKFSAATAQHAMGIDWMTHDELAQAIPPAYTEYIGGFMRAAL